jgi:hypothetical protein
MKAILFLLAIVCLAVCYVPGQKVVHEGEPTADMKRAIDAVVSKMNLDRTHKVELSKIDRIMHQLVAGRNYFLDIRVKSDRVTEHGVAAIVFQDLKGEMKVQRVDLGVRMDSLTNDERRGLFVIMEHLEKMHQTSIELVMIKSLFSKVVNGVIYDYHITYRGDKLPLQDEEHGAYMHWNGTWSLAY